MALRSVVTSVSAALISAYVPEAGHAPNGDTRDAYGEGSLAKRYSASLDRD